MKIKKIIAATLAVATAATMAVTVSADRFTETVGGAGGPELNRDWYTIDSYGNVNYGATFFELNASKASYSKSAALSLDFAQVDAALKDGSRSSKASAPYMNRVIIDYDNFNKISTGYRAFTLKNVPRKDYGETTYSDSKMDTITYAMFSDMYFKDVPDGYALSLNNLWDEFGVTAVKATSTEYKNYTVKRVYWGDPVRTVTDKYGNRVKDKYGRIIERETATFEVRIPGLWAITDDVALNSVRGHCVGALYETVGGKAYTVAWYQFEFAGRYESSYGYYPDDALEAVYCPIASVPKGSQCCQLTKYSPMQFSLNGVPYTAQGFCLN